MPIPAGTGLGLSIARELVRAHGGEMTAASVDGQGTTIEFSIPAGPAIVMLFLKRFWDPIARGEVTVTFRRWKAQQVLPGRRYRTAAGIIEIETVSICAGRRASPTPTPARAGHADAVSLIADLPVATRAAAVPD